ncbi:MAG: hypothetical protein V7L01_30765 [Nostoc sp.]
MTAPVEALLSVRGLKISLKILKMVRHLDFPFLSNEELIWNAEELFLELDRQGTLNEKTFIYL